MKMDKKFDCINRDNFETFLLAFAISLFLTVIYTLERIDYDYSGSNLIPWFLSIAFGTSISTIIFYFAIDKIRDWKKKKT